MPVERTERRRQNPIACQMCRAKKLKCDLGQPCSNCLSRKWTCEPAVRQDVVACQTCRLKKIKCDRGHPCGSCQLRQSRCEYSLEPFGSRSTLGQVEPANSAVHERLLRLEQAVFGSSSQDLSPIIDTEKGAFSPMTPWSNADGPQDIEFSQRLEDICGGLEDGTSPLAKSLVVEVKTTTQLAANSHEVRQIKKILLPPPDFASRVLDVYEQYLESAQQIMHVPTVREKVRQLYEHSHHHNASLQSGTAALLLAMSAHIGFWDTFKEHGLFPDAESAVKVSTVLAQQAMDALDYARDASVVTMETIQAAVLLVFLLYYIEGFSTRARVLHSTALSMARERGLHRIDAVQQDPSTQTQEALIEVETGRKLWWYLVTTDWLLAFNSGPTESIYTVMPQHMTVKKPRNLHTSDLTTQDTKFERPSNEPTNMAHFFVRIQLADICRDAVDCMPMQRPEAISYQKLRELDTRFDALAAALPKFLQLGVPAEAIKMEFVNKHGVQIGLQRALVNLMICFRRCKLHLPFLMRSNDPQYAFSRNACKESARRLIQVRQAFMDDSEWHTSSFLRLLGIDRFAFYATLVLVIDICVNSVSDHDQLIEVRNAVEVIEEAQSTNRTAKKFLNALRDVLKKHGIVLPSSHEAREEMPSSVFGDPVFDFSNLELLWPENLASSRLDDPYYWDGLVNLDLRLF